MVVDRDAAQWLDLIVLYFERLQQIAQYLACERATEEALWNEVNEACHRHQTVMKTLKTKVASSALRFDASVLHTKTLESAVEYMGFIVKGLSRHKYPPVMLIRLVGDFEQNLLDSRLFLAFRDANNQDMQMIQTLVEDIGAVRARIATQEAQIQA